MIFPANAKEHADAMLLSLANVCTRLSVPYFLKAGTCLGLYRDGTYIPDDSDLDVVIASTRFQEIISALHQEGIVVEGWGHWENRHFWKGNMLLDITWVEPEGFYADHDILRYNDYDYHIPHPIEEYLEWKYGDTWRTPLPKGQFTLRHED